jgi:biotin carboxyl carrier protein
VAGHTAHALRALRISPDGRCLLLYGTRVIQGTVQRDGGTLRIDTAHGGIEGTVERAAIDAMRQHLMQSSTAAVDFEIRTPIPGLVKAVLVEKGAIVAAGQPLVVLEAMKMENEIRAPHAGVIERVEAQRGQSLPGGALLLVLRPE